MATELLPADPIPLRQGAVYRARILVPFVGTVAAVKSGLEDQGWRDVQVWKKGQTPSDWPADQLDDPSGLTSWTAYAQGSFSLSDRSIPRGDIPHVDVLAMWMDKEPAGTPAQSQAPFVMGGDGMLHVDEAWRASVLDPTSTTQAWSVPSQQHAPGEWVRVGKFDPAGLQPTPMTGGSWVSTKQAQGLSIVVDRAAAERGVGVYLIAMPPAQAHALAAGPGAVVAHIEPTQTAIQAEKKPAASAGTKIAALAVGVAAGWFLTRLVRGVRG